MAREGIDVVLHSIPQRNHNWTRAGLLMEYGSRRTMAPPDDADESESPNRLQIPRSGRIYSLTRDGIVETRAGSALCCQAAAHHICLDEAKLQFTAPLSSRPVRKRSR